MIEFTRSVLSVLFGATVRVLGAPLATGAVAYRLAQRLAEWLTQHGLDDRVVIIGLLVFPWLAFARGGSAAWKVDAVKDVCLLAVAVASVVVSLLFLLGATWNPAIWEEARRPGPDELSRQDLAFLFIASLSAFVAAFAFVHWQLSVWTPRSYAPGALSKIDAVYFTLTVFTTTGFGDIHAETGTARAWVTTQMAVGLVLVAVVLSVAVNNAFRRPLDPT